MPKGQTQLIAKYESSKAAAAYDEDGSLIAIPRQAYQTLDLFIEHGLTPRITLQGNLRRVIAQENAQPGLDQTSGDIGARLALFQRSPWVISAYAGATILGGNDKTGLFIPSSQNASFEARALVGRELMLWNRRGFAELQFAELSHDGQFDQRRVESRLGMDLSPNWQVFTQTYAGENDQGAAWSKSELSIVRKFGRARLQAGWRSAVAGRSTASESGPVLALWYGF